jgi:hypothetical protein
MQIAEFQYHVWAGDPVRENDFMDGNENLSTV